MSNLKFQPRPITAKPEPEEKQVASSEVLELLYTRMAGKHCKDTCREIAKEFVDCLTEAIRTNDRVVLPKFGFFTKKIRSAHIGRNPKTGEPVQIPEREKVTFKGSPSLLEKE